MSEGISAGYLRSLEAIRGIGALAIVLYHLDDRLGLPFYFDNFYIGVDLFFVLSGFIIFHVYGGRIEDRAGYARFLWLRVARIYPLHFVTLVAFVAFQALTIEIGGSLAASIEPLFAHNDIWSFLANLAVIHALNLLDGPSFNVPSWSISTELYTYVVFGALFWVGLIRPDRPFAVPILIAIGGFALMAARTPSFNAMHDLGFIRNMVGFALGIAARGLHGLLPRPTTRTLTVLQIAAIAMLLVVLAVPGRSAPYLNYTVPLACAVLILACSHDRGGFCPILLLAPLQWLGRISYALYLTHYMLVLIVSALYVAAVQHGVITGKAWQPWVLIPVIIAITLPVAHATHVWVELPARTFLRQWGRLLPSAASPRT
ncbi:acyltransferase family protein [Vineibacter terrae]|nr:acyltransferase [Vineibacter terrae]